MLLCSVANKRKPDLNDDMSNIRDYQSIPHPLSIDAITYRVERCNNVTIRVSLVSLPFLRHRPCAGYFFPLWNSLNNPKKCCGRARLDRDLIHVEAIKEKTIKFPAWGIRFLLAGQIGELFNIWSMDHGRRQTSLCKKFLFYVFIDRLTIRCASHRVAIWFAMCRASAVKGNGVTENDQNKNIKKPRREEKRAITTKNNIQCG